MPLEGGPELRCRRKISWGESRRRKTEGRSCRRILKRCREKLSRVTRSRERPRGYRSLKSCFKDLYVWNLRYFLSDRDWRVKADVLAGMNRQIMHRGPDDDGFFIEENVGLAMRRLSIIDVKSGHQPLANENQDVWIVFNGEIYNHLELRADLEARGHHYRTRSDTETIVHLYEEYGRDCVRHLRGMFAFVIWDRRKRVLFAARDRLGIKPFYYRWDGRAFLFGSEIKTISPTRGLRRSSIKELSANIWPSATSQEPRQCSAESES